MFDLYEEFRKLIGSLDERQVEYALCGGLAMAVYDRPRTTVDIDLLIVLISLKTMRGRPQDLADIQALKEDIEDATN